MSDRHLPVRPNLDQLKHQAKDLLRAIKAGDPAAAADLLKHHPEKPVPSEAQLADAQLALARSYGLPSWPRLVLACRMTDAICRDDLDTVRDLVVTHPYLRHEDARGVKGKLGAEITDEHGDRLAPVAMILEGYGRHPAGKHACLEIVARHGIDLPDTAPMAVHRGRIDLLERTCSATLGCSRGRSLTRRSIRRHWVVTPTIRWRCTEPSSRARR